MSTAPRILVIGASGRVGQVLVRHLLAHGQAQLSLAARRLPAQPEACTERVRWHAVDVLDAAALAALCAGHHLVVQCAGPSKLLGARVARAAAAAGAAYLDPGGYDRLWQALTDPVPLQGRACVINAGLLPGLSGLLPRLLLERARAAAWPVERLDCFCVGSDAWTAASALDIIDSLGDFGAETPPSCVRHGQAQALPWHRAFRKHRFERVAGSHTLLLTRTLELERLAQRLAVPAVYAWGANNGPRAGVVLALTKLLGLYRHARTQAWASRCLVRASRADLGRQAPLFALELQLRLLDGRVMCARWRCGDTYAATGLLLGLAAERLCAGQGPQGLAMFEEAFEPEALIADLAGHGMPVHFETLAPGAVHGMQVQESSV